jgi:hypothetical protein
MDIFTAVLKLWKKLTIGGVLAMGMVASGPVFGDPVEDFQVFVTRNPFNLKDPPPPPKPPEKPPIDEGPPISLKLTGITSVRGKNRVMFINEPPNEDREFLSIMEGNRRDGIEVLAGGVDIAKGTVKIKIDNVAKTLSFENDGFTGSVGAKGGKIPQLKTTAARLPIPSKLSRTSGRSPSKVLPVSSGRSSAGGRKTTSFARPLRTSPTRSSGSTFTASGRSGVGIPPPTAANNTIRLNAGGAPVAVQPPAHKNVPPPAEQQILMELNDAREKTNPNVVEIRPGEFITVDTPPIPR